MNLELTKNEFEQLLQIIYAGSWMLNGLREDPITDFLDVEQKVFAGSRELKGGTDLLRWDKKYNQYLPSDKLESMMEEFLDDYDENVFWNELVHRLAARDVLDKFGEDGVRKMDDVEESEHIAEFSEKYGEEFETEGITRLRISEN